MSRISAKVEDERQKSRALQAEKDKIAGELKIITEKEAKVSKEIKDIRSGAEVTRLRQENQALVKERDHLKHLGSASIQKQVDLCAQMDKLEDETNVLKQVKDRVEAQLKAKEADYQHQLAVQKKQIDELKATPTEKEKWWKEEMASLKEKNEKLLEVLGQKAQKERDLSMTVNQLQGEKKAGIDTDLKERDDWKQKVELLEKRLFDKEVEYAKETKTLKAKLKKMKAQNTQLSKQVKALQGGATGSTPSGKQQLIPDEDEL